MAGRELEMHKDTEPNCLATVFERVWALESRGPDFLGEVLHELVWGQCLGNGNHRTSVLFLRTFVGFVGIEFPSPGERAPLFARSLDQWIGRSQALIRRRGEPGFAQARLEPKHREVTKGWVTEELADQSAALAMIGAQRLMDFIS